MLAFFYPTQYFFYFTLTRRNTVDDSRKISQDPLKSVVQKAVNEYLQMIDVIIRGQDHEFSIENYMLQPEACLYM